ncbi:Lrp/AsnC family transcriptional regulator [Thalassotalea sp. PLHSN55]|uniref:Lrp/AsnC family transcriptional regulator n=1 Tax=Thalassotalea sp. PLHSN55 TaxID=3435888 RepID=UPI003F83D6AE
MQISPLQQGIINRYQKGFPLTSEPFKTIADELNTSENEVISAFKELESNNVLSRIGPVFDHKKAGASTLAAIAVPPEQLDEIAEKVNKFEQVNHNYAREHDFNLWFVVTDSDWLALNNTLAEIEQATGLSVLVLPMEASYHIDLSFDVDFSQPTNHGLEN